MKDGFFFQFFKTSIFELRILRRERQKASRK